MIDIFVMISTVVCVLYIMLRAVVLDRSLPWFEPEERAARDVRSRRAGREG